MIVKKPSNPNSIRPIERQIIDEALKLAWRIWDGVDLKTSDFEQLVMKYQRSEIYKWRYRKHRSGKS